MHGTMSLKLMKSRTKAANISQKSDKSIKNSNS